MNNEDLTELERQQLEEQAQAQRTKGILGKFASDFTSGFKSGMYSNSADVRAIQERISKNGDFGMSNKGKKRKDESDESDDKKKKKDSELDDTSSEEKDKNESDEVDESEESDEEKENKKDKKKSGAEAASGAVEATTESSDDDGGETAKTLLKLKIFGIALLIFIVLVFAMTVAAYFETYLGSLTNLFGIPEATIEEDGSTRSGLLTEDEYLYDSNGNPLNSEQLVAKLNSEQECKVTVWNTIGDALFGGQHFKDRCAFMREIQRQTEGTVL